MIVNITYVNIMQKIVSIKKQQIFLIFFLIWGTFILTHAVGVLSGVLPILVDNLKHLANQNLGVRLITHPQHHFRHAMACNRICIP